ncbi:hypothetical protein IB229_14995 [Pseudomonas sp. PDM14]|uniref:DUF6176 family protein n=1 Tax=Pseudomonas sp. PDM14 TaxID=2769288 RepID=UPI0017867F3B|nr:DUF6176 family protein [Pseudomonas sp. PDM14]MBD9484291.1 hypothetical protein [Pseudomonas sp. PDM14]
MDVKAVLIKLKPDSQVHLATWLSEITRLKDEAITSIRNEGISVESWFEVQIAGEQYLLAYIRAGDAARAAEVAASSTLEVDRMHQQFKRDTWERSGMIDCKLLIDLHSEAESA